MEKVLDIIQSISGIAANSLLISGKLGRWVCVQGELFVIPLIIIDDSRDWFSICSDMILLFDTIVIVRFPIYLHLIGKRGGS